MRYSLLIIFLFYSAFANGQAWGPPVVGKPRDNADFKLFACNVGFGGITAGIGAIINKPEATPAHKAFFKGFYQGCLGGALQYGGKKMTYQIGKHENYRYGWPAKLLHNAGASIVENAALNRPFGRYWDLDLGLLRIDFAFAAQDENPVRVRFNAMLLCDIVAVKVQTKSACVDWGKSFKAGALTFYTNEPLYGRNNIAVAGRAYSKSYIYTNRNKEVHRTVAHELIHLFQYREHLVFNAWLNPLTSKAPSGLKKLFHNYIYIEPPYHKIFYLIEGYHGVENYYKNFYEYEAEWFANNGYFK